jgi:hypothetical protein
MKTDETLDLGVGRSVTPYYKDDRLLGYLDEHPLVGGAAGATCMGIIQTEHAPGYGAPRHRVVKTHPLTIEPSVLCRTCGNHGFIRDGKWVPA